MIKMNTAVLNGFLKVPASLTTLPQRREAHVVVAKLLKTRLVDVKEVLRSWSPGSDHIRVVGPSQVADAALQSSFLDSLSQAEVDGEQLVLMPKASAVDVFGIEESLRISGPAPVPALDAVSDEPGGGSLMTSGESSSSTSLALAGDASFTSAGTMAAAMNEDLKTRVLRANPEHAPKHPPVLPLTSQRIHDSIADGSVQSLQDAIQHCSPDDLEKHHPLHGGTALHVAAGHVVPSQATMCVEELLRGGSCVNVRAKNSSTPLHWAAGTGNEEVVRQLLSWGADPSLMTHTWATCVFGKGSGQTPAHWAAESGHTACVQALLGTSPVAPFLEDERGQRPADLSAKECHDDVTAVLLAAGEQEMVCVAVSVEARIHTAMHRDQHSGTTIDADFYQVPP